LKPLSQIRILWELLRSIPLLLLLLVQLKLNELREKMKSKTSDKSPSPQNPKETDSPSPPAPGSQVGPSPFEIEEGRKSRQSPGDQSLGGPFGTTFPAGKVPINPRVAGQLLNLPFKCLHIAYPVAQPLNEAELEAMAEPFSDFLVENGLEAIGRSSVVLGFHLFVAGYSRVKAIADWKKEQKIAAAPKTDPGHGEAREGKDDARPSADR
jgi:hypothetical protein